MSAPMTISKQLADPAFDQRKLFELGLARIRELAAHTWTDHNTHDPGLTMLELLAYALSDLAYRASLDIPTLLAGSDLSQQFPSARTILPNRALTELDFRKLLIDLPGVKNAWLRPAPFPLWADTIHGTLSRTPTDFKGEVKVEVSGLFGVLLECLEDVADVDAVIASVRRTLHANRNLCQDFVGVEIVDTQKFLLCCELDLEPAADAAAVGAEVLFRVGLHLAPVVPSLSLDEALARHHADGRPYTIDELFEGPALERGFILDEDLLASELTTELRLSDVIHVIMDVPGVVAVRDVVLTPAGVSEPPADPWLIPVKPGRKAVLDSDHSRLVYYKRGMAISAASGQLDARLAGLWAGVRAKDQALQREDLPIPSARPLDVGAYESVQNHFPAVYGIGPLGLPGDATDARRVQADQLKGFLLIFDQLMADFLAQLANVASLVSLDPHQQRARFHQVVDTLRDYARIYGLATDAEIQAMLDDLEPANEQRARREQFLDHLLARYAEQLADYAAIVRSAWPSADYSVFRAKCEFLRDYPQLGAERGLGFNHGLRAPEQLWDTPNVSGLQRRLARLLGLPNVNRRNLSSVRYDLYAEIDSTPNDEFRFRVRKSDDSNKILLSGTTRYATHEDALAEMYEAIRLGQSPAGYARKRTQDGRHHFTIIKPDGEIVARRIEYFESEDALEHAILETMDYLLAHYSDEGLYVIESILLRPRADDDPLMPICPDPNCTECLDQDPYSYRIHVLLPAYSQRFVNMEFRRFIEQTIRAECPAHILPKICWLSRLDMGNVEKAYRDWLFANAGVEDAQVERGPALQALIDALFKVRSVYPPARLHACDSDESAPHFMLGRTTLGTLEKP